MNEKRWLITIALFHCIAGNIIGVSDVPVFIQTLFLPYSFISGMSSFAGWDELSLILEVVSFGIMTMIIYAIIYLIEQLRNQKKQ